MNKALNVMAGLTLAILLYPLLPNVSGQQVSIKSYAVNEKFFGEGILQVVITDPNADNDSTVEEVTVEIDAEPDVGSAGTITILIPETSGSSGKFEFFLLHENATAVGPSDLDAINSRGVQGDGSCVLDCAPFVTFGTTGDLAVDADLYEDVGFQIVAGNTEVEVSYEETNGTLELDRSSYGSNSFVYVFVNDQDANLDPTNVDQFTMDPDNPPNADIFSLNGGSLNGIVVFKETGDNTARFEGKYQLGNSISVVSESVVLTLFEKANYAATLASPENDSNGSDEVSFTVGDSDPSIDIGGQPGVVTFDPELSPDKDSYLLGETVTVTIEDPDANINSSIADSIILELSSRGVAEISALETGPNTGIFESSLSLGSDGAISDTNVKVENRKLVIAYADKRPADYAEKIVDGQNPEREFSLEIDIDLDPNSIVLKAPIVRTSSGATGPYPVGAQLVLSTTVENDSVQQYVVIIEARDENGVTIFLGLQSGTLVPDVSSGIEVSWTPEVAGDYQIRAFVISSLSGGEVLSGLSSSDTSIV